MIRADKTLDSLELTTYTGRQQKFKKENSEVEMDRQQGTEERETDRSAGGSVLQSPAGSQPHGVWEGTLPAEGRLRAPTELCTGFLFVNTGPPCVT